MEITIRHTEGCPHVGTTEARLKEALMEAGITGQRIIYQVVDNDAEAKRLGFRGSPTILLDGDDPFEDHSGTVGLACRLYPTASGYEGSPSVSELRDALHRRKRP